MTPEVIVVGAGPVGLTAALTLARAGVAVVVLERRSALNTASKASTFHPPTLEILDDLGVLDRVVREGVRVDRIQFRDAHRGVVAEFHMSALQSATRFPFRLHLEQAALTPHLLDAARACGNTEVLFGRRVTRVASSGEGVVAEFDSGDGPQTLAGRYLLAADGAHSDARASLGIGFEGSDYDTKVLRVLTPQPVEDTLPGVAPLTYVYRDDESLSLLKMPDCWRIILRVSASLPDDVVLEPVWYRERVAPFFPDLFDQMIDRAKADVFPVSKRIAATNQVGRIVLAGDAVHVTNTRGGMNMNCGIHDAFALAKASIPAIRDGDEAPLARAAAARLRVARDELIPRTDRRVATGAAWLADVKATAGDARAARDFLYSSSMLDMR